MTESLFDVGQGASAIIISFGYYLPLPAPTFCKKKIKMAFEDTVMINESFFFFREGKYRDTSTFFHLDVSYVCLLLSHCLLKSK